MALVEPSRYRLPGERYGKNHHVVITSVEEKEPGVNSLKRTDMYITANHYPDGSPAEVFCSIDQAGSRVGSLVDAWCTAVSVSLQYGIPLKTFTSKARGTCYEPSGFTSNPKIPKASSPLDYLARWLEKLYGLEEA